MDHFIENIKLSKFQRMHWAVLQLIKRDTVDELLLSQNERSLLLQIKQYFDFSINQHPYHCMATKYEKMCLTVLLPYVLQSDKVVIFSPSKKHATNLLEAFGLRNNICKSYVYQNRLIIDKEKLKYFLVNGTIVNLEECDKKLNFFDLLIVNLNASSEMENVINYFSEMIKCMCNFSTIILYNADDFSQSLKDGIANFFLNKQIVFLN